MAEALLWQINLLGGFRVAYGPNIVAENAWRRRKAAALIKLLALADGHRLHGEQVIETLWPNQRDGAGANSLYQAIHHARLALATVHTDSRHCLQFQADHLALCPDELAWIDAEAFEAAARAAQGSADLSAYKAAIALYTGNLLPEDLYEDWVAPRRTSLRLTYLSLLSSVAALYENCQEHAQAIATLEQVVAVDPAQEPAHRSLMRLYALTGDRPRALRQYQTLCDTLRRELDAEPDATSQALYRQILSGRDDEHGGAAVTPAQSGRFGRTMEPVSAPKGNLPRFLTSFVGREAETAELLRLTGTTRLLTLTGPGGCGKTRLALALATEMLAGFPAGAWWVDLAALTEPSLAPRAVASALQVSEQAGPTLTQALVNNIGQKRLLLVLDNCEHLVDACASLAEALLTACPCLSILATSRERLAVPGEVIWPVPALALPDPRRLPAVPELLDYSAIRLFCERAAAARPGFVLTAGNAKEVVDLCVPLDAMPLAIELAAARVRLLTTGQIAAGLADRFALLNDGYRTTAPRHRTLRATIDWSYDLLSESERILFRRLAVFRGGFTLQAAKAVCDASLEVLGRLVDKSLVQVDASGAEARYRLLETVQQYAAEKLALAEETAKIQDCHLRFYLGQAEEAEPWLKTGERGAWLARLDGEIGNFRAALARGAKSQETADAGLRLAVALSWFWHARGYWHERKEWLTRLLEDSPAADALLRARAMSSLGASQPLQPELLRESVAIARGLGESGWPVLAEALRMLMYAEMGVDDEAATRHIEENVALARAANSTWDLAHGLLAYGVWSYVRGDAAAARRYYSEALRILRELGDHEFACEVLNRLGQLEATLGNYSEARRWLEESATTNRRLNYPAGLAFSLGYLGEVALAEGAYEEDARLLDECIPLLRDLGYVHPTASCTYHRALVAERLGDYELCSRLLIESMTQLRSVDYADGIIGCLVAFASLALALRQHVRAARLLGATAALLESSGFNWHDHNGAKLVYAAVMERIRPILDQPEGADAWTRGKAMTLDESVEFALNARTQDV